MAGTRTGNALRIHTSKVALGLGAGGIGDRGECRGLGIAHDHNLDLLGARSRPVSNDRRIDARAAGRKTNARRKAIIMNNRNRIERNRQREVGSQAASA